MLHLEWQIFLCNFIKNCEINTIDWSSRLSVKMSDSLFHRSESENSFWGSAMIESYHRYLQWAGRTVQLYLREQPCSLCSVSSKVVHTFWHILNANSNREQSQPHWVWLGGEGSFSVFFHNLPDFTSQSNEAVSLLLRAVSAPRTHKATKEKP